MIEGGLNVTISEKIEKLWEYIAKQDAEQMKTFFAKEAVICWHNSNEEFTLSEYIRANCEYPGEWQGQIERLEMCGETAVSVAQVKDRKGNSFRSVSFYHFADGKIDRMDEYWGDEGEAPRWRKELEIGKPIR